MYTDIFTTANNEPCFIRKPNIPNDYGVIILGGSSCFVTEDSSDFHENPVRNTFMEELASHGYTIGYSNTRNVNWGSPRAVRDVEALYKKLVTENELNPRVHLIATSMGSILALKILSKCAIPLRSIILVKPVMDLCEHRNYVFQREKIDRIVNEISDAYLLKIRDVIAKVIKEPITFSEELSQEVKMKIVYGKRDDTSPFENSVEVINALTSLGYSIEIASLSGATHKDDYLFFNTALHIPFLGENQSTE